MVNKNASQEIIVYPNFLYIGTAKAGSTWIYEVLREHPEVFVPKAKDVQFFDSNYDKGFDWYLSLFQIGMGKKAIGELSHNYFLSAQAAVRIAEHLPDVRLFCSLREPVEQISSNFLQRKAQSTDKSLSFRDFARQEDVLKACDYYHNLLPFYRIFPRDRILVLFFDELKQDPALFIRRIYDFLEIDPAFVPSALHRRVLSAREPRLSWLAHGAYQMGLLFRKLGFVNLVGTVKRNSLFQSLFYRQAGPKPAIEEEVRQELVAYYAERYSGLPELIGQPLPAGWP
jgi:hypothetical protein